MPLAASFPPPRASRSPGRGERAPPDAARARHVRPRPDRTKPAAR
ncbi:hypothetical protein BMASAVP1_A2416 [Burkholderia mallei SAVP1]|nr:hypothetical protein BMASAVP1_A2416 [Burkholderia mallei SAVP1]